MPSFIAKRWTACRSSVGRRPHARRPIRDQPAQLARRERRPLPGSQDGFLLIEVIVSAVLVGIIVIATFTGFAVVNRVSADERFHNQAAALAAESQEQLRSDPASALQTLESGHSYKQTIGGTTYTIAQQT